VPGATERRAHAGRLDDSKGVPGATERRPHWRTARALPGATERRAHPGRLNDSKGVPGATERRAHPGRLQGALPGATERRAHPVRLHGRCRCNRAAGLPWTLDDFTGVARFKLAARPLAKPEHTDDVTLGGKDRVNTSGP